MALFKHCVSYGSGMVSGNGSLETFRFICRMIRDEKGAPDQGRAEI